MERYLKTAVVEDLKEKMVFLGGPRQVGKTTLALSLLKNGSEEHPAYLNWDDSATRKALLQGTLPSGEELVALDEIHKYKKWRNLVKGFYDLNKSRRHFLVTGSAKLDTDAVAQKVALLRQYIKLPIGVGFGINNAESARKIAVVADAVIVGSCIVKEIEENPGIEAQAVGVLAKEKKNAIA